jgi:type II secretory pathway component PulC
MMGVLFFVVVALAVRQALRPEIVPVGAKGATETGPGDLMKLATVRERDVYDAIAARRLFGKAGAFKPGKKPEEKPPPPPPTETAEETKLPLKLFGTALSEGPDARAAAIIDVREGGKGTKTFYLGDEVTSNVLLKEVRPASVVLDNRRTNRLELLQIDWSYDGLAGAGLSATRRSVSPTATINRPNLITLNREEITKKVEDEYARVASSLNVRVVNGRDGEVQGITTDNIEQYDVAQELGFKNGDVLVSVNNEPVKSREDAVNVVKKYRNASIFRVGVLRSGQMMYITYRVR